MLRHPRQYISIQTTLGYFSLLVNRENVDTKGFLLQQIPTLHHYAIYRGTNLLK